MTLGLRGKLFLLSLGLIVLSVLTTYLYLSAHLDRPDRLRPLLLSASMLALGAALLLSGLAAHLIPRPVRKLTEVARRMAQGDLKSRTHKAGSDEVAALGGALDQLAENLSLTLSELRAERDLLQGILKGMQEGVLVLDHDGCVVLINPALREMLLLPESVLGKSQLEAVRHGELKDLLDRARLHGERVSGEIEVSGIKPRRLLVHATVLPASTGSLLAVFVDVTDIRRLESLRRDFVANVSHELRTPVTAVRSAAETLRQAAVRDPEAAPRFIDIIDRNAERLQRLVEDLLDLSRIESRAYRFHAEELSIRGVAQHVLSLFRERADKKHLRLCTPAQAAPLLLGSIDRRALEQVLTNLIDNAVKYCQEGAEISVRVTQEGDRLRVAVEDTGPGVDPRHLPRLFERFYRADAGRSRDLGGTGLGLSIVKHLVEAWGGEVSVESTVGRGSTFSFTVPGDGV